MSTRSSSWSRRAELTLWLLSASLLGVAVEARVGRQAFQAEQERRLESRLEAAATRPSTKAPMTVVSPIASDQTVRRANSAPTLAPVDAATDIAPRSGSDSESPTPRNISKRIPAPRPKTEEHERTLPDDGLLGKIVVPRLGISAIVREGDDEAVLRRAVGWVADTAPPGAGGNTALAAHRDTFFRPLERVREGDSIQLLVPPHTYEYRVESISIVAPDDISVLASSQREELTLVTCYPFRAIGPAPERFIVKASRVN